MADKQLMHVDVDQLQPNPLQPRGHISDESVAELADSIRQYGVLEPLLIAQTPAGMQIIAGERRWRAAKLVGLRTVPAMVHKTTPQKMLEMALVENVQREALNPLERAKGLHRLINEFHLSPSQVADMIGRSRPYISNTLRLLTLPDAIKDGLLTGLITEGHARALSAIQDPKRMVQAYRIVLKENASVRRTEQLARKISSQEDIHKVKVARGWNYQTPTEAQLKEVEELQKNIYRRMGIVGGDYKRVKVKVERSRRLTRVVITLRGTPKRTAGYYQRLLKLFGIEREVTTELS